MLSPTEKRFIKYWEEQRTGGRWPYYLMYIIAGTIIATIVFSFLVMMLVIGGVDYLIPIAAFSLVVVTAITIYSWQNNERRFKTIIRREIEEGKRNEDNGMSGQLV